MTKFKIPTRQSALIKTNCARLHVRTSGDIHSLLAFCLGVFPPGEFSFGVFCSAEVLT